MTVNTSKVARRELRFESIDDLIAELNRIEQAEALGQLQVLGKWSPGQIVSHLAAWIEYGWDGFPMKRPPFFVRWILSFMGKKFLRTGLPSGMRIPGVKGGTFGQDDVPLGQALARLRTALQRLKNGELAKFDSPAFGPLSHEDRIRLNLRHAELHLSFMTL